METTKNPPTNNRAPVKIRPLMDGNFRFQAGYGLFRLKSDH